jgi:hypothetical protein
MTQLQFPHFVRRAPVVLAVGALLVCSACVAEPPVTTLSTYRYRHLETTGITSEVRLADGTLQPVMFAPESSQGELKALGALHDCLIFGTLNRERTASGEAFEQRLFLVGELRPQVLRTPEGDDVATPEDYKVFVLHTWYLEAPFSVMVSRSPGIPLEDLDTPRHVREHSSVRPACPALAAHGNVDRFVRVRTK